MTPSLQFHYVGLTQPLHTWSSAHETLGVVKTPSSSIRTEREISPAVLAIVGAGLLSCRAGEILDETPRGSASFGARSTPAAVGRGPTTGANLRRLPPTSRRNPASREKRPAPSRNPQKTCSAPAMSREQALRGELTGFRTESESFRAYVRLRQAKAREVKTPFLDTAWRPSSERATRSSEPRDGDSLLPVGN